MGDLFNLNRLAYFTAVVEAGSFTAAADRLGVAKAVVSHQVGKLEEELGVTLLARTTRRLRPTEDGRLFYARCAPILRDAQAAYGELSANVAEPSGTLTLTASTDYGAAVVAPVVAEYLRRYPAMKVRATFDDARHDLVADGIDLAIRLGRLSDSSSIAQRFGRFGQVVVAAPSLARRCPAHMAPQDLCALPWIGNLALDEPYRWRFTRAGAASGAAPESARIRVAPTLVADKTATAYALALAGAGVSVFPDYVAAADLASGRLCRLLPGWTLPHAGIHAVYPPSRFRPARVKVFVDMMKEAERRRAQSA